MATTYQVIGVDSDPGFLQELSEFLDICMLPDFHNLIQRKQFNFKERFRSLVERYQNLDIVTVTLPTADEMLDGSVASIGSTSIAGNVTLPAVGDVQEGVEYGVGGSGSVGTFVVPTEAQVENLVEFGADGTEFTGSLGA